MLKLQWRKVSRQFLLLGLFIWPFLTEGQSPHFIAPSANDYRTDIVVTEIFESHQGYIWLGSEEGLFRYDGIEYKAYELPKDSISRSKKVSTIYQTKDQKLWVGFSDGKLYAPTYDAKLKPWEKNEALELYTPISNLWEQGEALWVATYGQGLFILTPDSTYHFTEEEGLLGNDIYQMNTNNEGQVFLATDRGINTCSFKDGQLESSAFTNKDGLPGYIVRTMKEQSGGSFCVGTYDNGVFQWIPETNAVHQIVDEWPYGTITDLELFEGQELWIATERRGLIRYNFKTDQIQVINVINDLSIGRIIDLQKDREGNLWISSNNLGLLKTNRHFDFLEKQPEVLKNIQVLISDYKNKLWIGTQNGIFQLETGPEGQSQYKRKIPEVSSNILSLYEDKDKNLWIGTYGEGVFIYDQENNRIRQLREEDGLVNGNVLSIDGYDNKIWVGTFSGVTQFVIDDNVFDQIDIPYNQYDAEEKLNAVHIHNVFVDSKKRIWLGTNGEGINVIEDEQLSYFEGADSINFKSVYSITEDLLGNIWFTTTEEGFGLFKYNGEKFQQYGLNEGLRNLKITSLITDDNGNIVILHPSGIDVLDPSNDQIIYYAEHVGISNLEPSLNVVTKDQNGDIWIGGQRQVLKYISPNENFRMTPKTALEQVDVAGDLVDFEEQNKFKYNQNTFLFKFKGLWYTDPDAVQYRYKLEGFDRNWKSTRDREINYVNLPPGSYTFMIGTTANNIFSQEPIEAFSFNISRPFWEEAWFYLPLALLIIGVSVLLFRAREQRIIRESRLKREKIESQFEALKSQINPHFLFNSFNTLVAIIEESPDLAVNYVERLSDFYRSILQYRDKPVIPLAEEINVVRNYFYLLKERFGNNLSLKLNIQEEEAYVPPLSIQMLVENAIKHNIVSSTKPLEITIAQDLEGQLMVKNTLQPKRIRPKSTSFGLSSIVARFGLLSEKKVQINQTNKEFIVTLPLIRSKYSSQEHISTARLEEIEDELGQS